MTDTSAALDLSALPPPEVVETLDYEAILAEMVADLRARAPAFDALVESDPAFKILEVAAYRELLLRQRVNEAARATMLAYAAGSDLDQIAANYAETRFVIDAGDPDAIPPVAPTYESDADLRRRVQLVPEGYTVAGSRESYVFHALSADADVKDAQAVSPSPGEVAVYVLSRSGTGQAGPALIAAVEAALSADTIRPLTDKVTVLPPAVTEYSVAAVLTVLSGPDADVVRAAAENAVLAYVAARHGLGVDVTLSGLYAALHQPGVQNVALVSPTASLAMGEGAAAYCTGVTVTIGGGDG